MRKPPRMPTLEFWFDFASPYSYLAAARIERFVAGTSVRVEWRPFLIGPILARRPDRPSPFQGAPPAQARYRRRDVERWCEREGIPLRWPSTYPRGSLLATRVALIAADEGWCPDFARAVYRANFAEDRDIGAAGTVAALIEELGRAAADLLARATTEEHKARLAREVERAAGKGIFGAPSFLAGDELFWGNDRLEAAIEWAAGPAKARPELAALLRRGC
jgi:2-hydroxychromene-2-carboxylate isomerase